MNLVQHRILQRQLSTHSLELHGPAPRAESSYRRPSAPHRPPVAACRHLPVLLPAATYALYMSLSPTLQNGNLVAVDPSGRPNRWTFRNGTLGTPPVASGAVVFVGGSAGKVYAVSASSGAKLWTGTASSPNASGVAPMAVGGGLLVVPAGPTLTAFGN